MTKIKDAQDILRQLDLPAAQCNDMAALTLLALADIEEGDLWNEAKNPLMSISKDIMEFVNNKYGVYYAPNTRETFRRHVLHQFVQARIVAMNVDDPLRPVNSPKNNYSLTPEVLKLLKTYKTSDWERSLSNFKKLIPSLNERYHKKRVKRSVPVSLPNGDILSLTPGKHNILQAAIVEEFASQFISDPVLLYLGDTAKKDLFVEKDLLESLGIPINQHSKLPDVVILDKTKKWLFLIEAVTSHGPISPKRLEELEDLLANCKIPPVYVTAFLNMSDFKKYTIDIAFETEVWIKELPEHMIHYNGDRFLGPRK